MGMDFISLGFTAEREPKIDLDKTKQLIQEHMPQIAENEFAMLDRIDPSGGFLEVYEDDTAQTVRDIEDTLVAGANAVGEMVGRRISNIYPIPGTSLELVVAGGDSWGDPPFEDFDQASIFLNLCEIFPEIGKEVGVVAGGIATLDVLNQYRVED